MPIERFTVLLLSAAVAVCSAQNVTSAHSGTVHYTEGEVSIDGTPYHQKTSVFPELKEQSVFATAQGRAEVLLTPGVFLRLGENTSIRMLDNRLSSTRVDILDGAVTVESDDPMMSVQKSPVTLLFRDYQIRIVKHGLIEITSSPSEMKVLKGEAEVSTNDNRATVKEGHLLPFAAGLTTEKFDEKTADDLYLWTRDRSNDLSAANMASARSLSNGSAYGYAGAPAGGNWGGGWYFNPYFDMFTYVPAAGTLFSPFGFGFFSPFTIGDYYYPGTYWYGGGGARGAAAGQTLTSGLGSSTKVAAPIANLRGSGAARSGAGSFGSAGVPSGGLSAPIAARPASAGGGGLSSGARGGGGAISAGVATRGARR